MMKRLRIHYRNLFFFLLLFCLVLLIITCSLRWQDESHHENVTNQKSKPKNINESHFNSPLIHKMEKNEEKMNFMTKKFITDMMEEEKCPSCFGFEVCEEIHVQFIKFTSKDIQEIDSYKIFEGQLGSLQKVFIKVPTSLNGFDNFCVQEIQNKDHILGCKSYPTLSKFLPFSTEAISSVHNIQNKLGFQHHVSFLSCTNLQLENIITSSFDHNDDKSLDKDEKTMLFTSMVLAPEVIISKILTKLGMSLGFPQYFGACGRAFVTESGLKPLSLFMDKPFIQRVALAVQLISHVEDFLDKNANWMAILPTFEVESIAVNGNGEVVFTKIQDLIFSPRSPSDDELKICNSDCIHTLQERSFMPSENNCFTHEEANNLMIAQICLLILSDMKQHKFIDYYSHSSSARTQHRPWLGLLHTIPENERQDVEHFLSLCVDETSPGERVTAFEDLQDLLTDILEEEEVDYNDDADDDDDYLDEEQEKEQIENDIFEHPNHEAPLKKLQSREGVEQPKSLHKEEY